MKKDKILPLLLIAGGIWIWSTMQTDKRAALVKFARNNTTDTPETKARFIEIIGQMSDMEVNVVYSFLFDYMAKGRKVPPGSSLANQISVISEKYNIFT